ncbi:hypothetical protein GA0061101_12172 [Rhizobium lusitanum]|uniref:Uncharacterized protein n=1 Tax=Rhizobium lusitanum TaxID=293958 RepID=A0A1C3X058_9HYPH|nr:hypothetical protein GA0061101_12172 [Rhizobium lusitanum]
MQTFYIQRPPLAARFSRQNKGNRRLRGGSFLGFGNALQTTREIGGALHMGGGGLKIARLSSFTTLSYPHWTNPLRYAGAASRSDIQ